MSWGIQTQGAFGRLPIDGDYQNLVLEDEGSISLSAGYRNVGVRGRGDPSLTVAVRHPGLEIAFLGFITDSYGVKGVRLHVRGSGRLYWRSYKLAEPLPEDDWGMVVYNAKGEQTFHSDHNYADVKTALRNAAVPYSLANNYYFLIAPSSPEFVYESFVNGYGQRDYGYYYEYERVCEWVGFGMDRELVCDYVQVRKWGVVGYYHFVSDSVNCDKYLTYLYHNNGKVGSIKRKTNSDIVYIESYTFYESVPFPGTTHYSTVLSYPKRFDHDLTYSGHGADVIVVG